MQLLDISIEKVNINGGAIALGHPIAMSGSRIIQSLLSAFKVKGGRYGIATICNGGGESTAMII
jgi:acetyl-CoA C-acetyltransferase